MLRPLADRIVVQSLDPPLSTTLTVIQMGRDGRHTRGKILAIGPGKRTESGMLVPLECKVGDIIHFTDAFKFPEIIDHGQKVLILQEADIAGIEEDGYYHSTVAETQQSRMTHSLDDPTLLTARMLRNEAERLFLKEGWPVSDISFELNYLIENEAVEGRLSWLWMDQSGFNYTKAKIQWEELALSLNDFSDRCLRPMVHCLIQCERDRMRECG